VTPLDWLDSLQNSGIRPGLERMRALLRALGNPHQACPAVIVAGTNGKGSTSAMLASILVSSGKRTAHYTSPHLVDLRERWTIDGRMVSPEVLESAILELQDAAKRIEIVPTYFEALTLLAFVIFARQQCEIAVLEVGMGGRLDATNVVRPLAAVITPVGMDHTEYLGTTLRAIAREKAGVIHRGALALTSNDDPMVLEVLRKRAAQFGETLVHVTDEHDTPLAGPFQRRNAGLAVATARALGIDEDSIARGVAATHWRGRLERIDFGGKSYWIDGGHNAHAVRQTAPYLDTTVPRPRLLVFGIMSDKDVAPVTATLFPLFDRILTTEPYPPRSVRADSFPGAEPIPDPVEALRAAVAAPERNVVITGSLYLAGAAIAFLDTLRAT
jgi:dihydrofolate synthase/folylpolyglutamate synthase